MDFAIHRGQRSDNGNASKNFDMPMA